MTASFPWHVALVTGACAAAATWAPWLLPTSTLGLLGTMAAVFTTLTCAYAACDRSESLWIRQRYIHPVCQPARRETEYLPLVIINAAVLGLVFVATPDAWLGGVATIPTTPTWSISSATTGGRHTWTASSFLDVWALTATGVVILGTTFHLVFYVGHRALHTSWLMPWHRRHHATLANCGLTALYMHPVDALVEVVLPLWVSLVAFQPPVVCAAAFVVLVAVEGVLSHGGYVWPGLSSPDHHILHHLYPTRYFGIFDW